MTRVVFDIETLGYPIDTFDETQQEGVGKAGPHERQGHGPGGGGEQEVVDQQAAFPRDRREGPRHAPHDASPRHAGDEIGRAHV